MPDDAKIVLIALVGLAVIGWYMYNYFSRSRLLLRRWADENGYELLHAEQRMFRKGPYMWSSRAQAVYRVEIRDGEGRRRKGWVRCGAWFSGVFGDKVEARLDESS